MNQFRVLYVLLAACAGSVVCSHPTLGAPDVIAGGYTSAPISDRQVVLATRYAIQAQRRKTRGPIKLVVLQRAERQIVAGTNYRLNFQAKIGEDVQSFSAVVYQDLEGKYSLSSWNKVK